jgi:hypothetical protein
MSAKVLHFKYVEHSRGRYRFTLTEPARFWVPQNLGYHEFKQGDKVWLKIRGHDIIISNDYSWDGSSPKFNVCGKWFGTPDIEATRAASCYHDATGQFRQLKCLSSVLSWGQWNSNFADIIRQGGRPTTAKIFHTGLVIFNPLYQILGKLVTKKDKTLKCVYH